MSFKRRPFPMGHLEKTVCLATVSGVASTKPELIRYFCRHVPAVGIITTKSYQVRPNPGNREPVICETSEGNFGNSVGLRNPGMEAALPELEKLRNEGLEAWLNTSVSADNPEDFVTLVKAFDGVSDSIELNFSCPHAKAGYGASIGVDAKTASSYVRQICADYPERKSLLFVKLTPNVDDIGEIAKAVIDAGADGITAINTVGPVLHTDPVAGKPVLQNHLGGKGGKSGEWVYERAIEAIREIRAAVGDKIPIIGMGGVSDGEKCAAMIAAGADAVGIGSALAHVGQKNWGPYFDAVRTEAEAILKGEKPQIRSREMLSRGRTMQYTAFKVSDIVLHSEDTMFLYLDGSMKDFKAGEFVFLWIPGIGEKPFSVAKSDPLMFLIKKRGIFTGALFDTLRKGDTIYMRGPYGEVAQMPEAERFMIIAGGTGEAVAYPLACKLNEEGKKIAFMVGTSVEGNRGTMEEDLRRFGRYICVSDSGKPGRILDHLEDEISALAEGADANELAYCLVGPEIFMKITAKKIKALGVSPERILLSMEKNTMCGVGLCGECSCGGRLACQWGSFMSLDFLEKENVL